MMLDDPFLWLEDVEGVAPLAQVDAWNRATAAPLEADPAFAFRQAAALAVLDDDRRIAMPTLLGDTIYNFWKDATHVRGVWRRSSLGAYVDNVPDWEILIDLDVLADDEGRNWVWSGALILPGSSVAMISLSDGGADATVSREFDTAARAFVEDGFILPEAKTTGAWLDEDTLLVATDFGSGTLTASGYPAQLRRWRRGTPIGDAPLMACVEPDAMMIEPLVLRDATARYPLVMSRHDFWTSDIDHVAENGTLHRSPLPSTAQVMAVHDGFLIAQLQHPADLGEGELPTGMLVAYDIAEVLAGKTVVPERVMAAPATGSIAGLISTTAGLLIGTTEHVASRQSRLSRIAHGEWTLEPQTLPENRIVNFAASDPSRADYFYVTAGFINPLGLHFVDPVGTDRSVARQPERFDPACYTVEQRFAISTDGTRVPYFIVAPHGQSGPVPTMLYAYGGFRQSLTPAYVSPLVQAWLEAGNAYVLANLRGGGEYGPEWHAAALRDNRQRAFDDLHAVAQALRADGVADQLVVHGASNGGLLVGVAYTQRPELYDAVLMGVPLADMRRYHMLLAGASWMAEYGDPDDPADWQFIARYSPYHNLSADRTYPPVLFYTSTRDDRVHPAHARKMAARMEALGHRFGYYENVEGGHGGAANARQAAYQTALILGWLDSVLGTSG